MLTPAQVKSAQPRADSYKLHDEGGLMLFVATTGTKSWRMKYRLRGRGEQLLTIGRYPEISLSEARAARDQARELLERGADPAAARRRERAAAELAAISTFESVARAWHEQRAARWSPAHAADVISSLERDVFPAIGARSIADIDESDVLELLQGIEARGNIETARRIRQRLDAVFAIARRKKLRPDNPAADIGDELAPRPPAKPQPALLELEQLKALLAAADAAPGAAIVKLAHRFLALTAVRMDALRGARWAEIEDLDGDAPLWRVPAARMKLAKTKKAEAAFDHLVPLSAAAVAVLRAARESGHDTHSSRAANMGGLVFPGRGRSSPIGEAAIGALIARAGFKGLHVPHGWRASFSTVMNEKYPGDRAAIDLALAHSGKSMGKVEGAYNRAQHLSLRRDLFERWSAILAA